MKLHERIFGDNEAATYLGISRGKIIRLKKLGKIPYLKIGGSFQYLKSDLDQVFYHKLKEGER